jgi:hypothetical protein
MSRPVADFTINEEGLAVASELGSGHIPWSTVADVWERPTYWMIFTAPSQFITFPILSVVDGDRDLIRSRVSHTTPRGD